MSNASAVSRLLVRSPLIAVVLYIVAAGGLVAIAVAGLLDIQDRSRTLRETSELLSQLESRGPRSGAPSAAQRTGSPFLEGPTVTVAGAALLQRVAAAVTNVGGTVQSSQVDVAGNEARNGFVGLLVSCEMEQPALQKLLYDLEAGMPFLFVDQLDVQIPQSTASDESSGGRIRVLLGISGQWQGAP
ncbi:type II secretion system protein GspM [Tardiphaga sp.]|uniref:type II secretion system protein GspM n=1 Tax=Tardiphaga sp. TaxID=1926292 RepID=UPI00261D621A|nr:type II secretion system protein GspM [Tardiphaga sp.]MDB5617778.1 hypothetical protein [Tardiphaga sp.]